MNQISCFGPYKIDLYLAKRKWLSYPTDLVYTQDCPSSKFLNKKMSRQVVASEHGSMTQSTTWGKWTKHSKSDVALHIEIKLTNLKYFSPFSTPSTSIEWMEESILRLLDIDKLFTGYFYKEIKC